MYRISLGSRVERLKNLTCFYLNSTFSPLKCHADWFMKQMDGCSKVNEHFYFIWLAKRLKWACFVFLHVKFVYNCRILRMFGCVVISFCFRSLKLSSRIWVSLCGKWVADLQLLGNMNATIVSPISYCFCIAHSAKNICDSAKVLRRIAFMQMLNIWNE